VADSGTTMLFQFRSTMTILLSVCRCRSKMQVVPMFMMLHLLDIFYISRHSVAASLHVVSWLTSSSTPIVAFSTTPSSRLVHYDSWLRSLSKISSPFPTRSSIRLPPFFYYQSRSRFLSSHATLRDLHMKNANSLLSTSSLASSSSHGTDIVTNKVQETIVSSSPPVILGNETVTLENTTATGSTRGIPVDQLYRGTSLFFIILSIGVAILGFIGVGKDSVIGSLATMVGTAGGFAIVSLLTLLCQEAYIKKRDNSATYLRLNVALAIAGFPFSTPAGYFGYQSGKSRGTSLFSDQDSIASTTFLERTNARLRRALIASPGSSKRSRMYRNCLLVVLAGVVHQFFSIIFDVRVSCIKIYLAPFCFSHICPEVSS
jgi:hypothetical protein